MRKYLSVSVGILFLLVSCQKEVSLETPGSAPGGGGGNTGGTKLVRMGSRDGADTATVDYSYNGAGSLTNVLYTANVIGIPVSLQYRIVRNAANIVTTIVHKSPVFLQAGFESDSLVYLCTYNTALGRYSSMMLHYVLDDIPMSDSLVFAYDTNKKLVSQTSYYRFPGEEYEPDLRQDFTYSGDNLQSMKEYIHDGSRFELSLTETFEYDNKVSPLHFPVEAPILGMSQYYSANNISKRTKQSEEPPQTQTTSFTYTYNADNKPVKSVGTSGGISGTNYYFYQ